MASKSPGRRASRQLVVVVPRARVEHLIVEAALGHELGVRPLLGDGAVLHDDDAVGEARLRVRVRVRVVGSGWGRNWVRVVVVVALGLGLGLGLG